MKRKTSNTSLLSLWAGLLILSSPVQSLLADEEFPGEPMVQFDGILVRLSVQNTSIDDVVREIAAKAGLRLVQHVALDRLMSAETDWQPLPEALEDILSNDSYQLYQEVSGMEDSESGYPIPGSLWIFSEGTATAPAATAFLEAIIFQGDFVEKKEAIRELRRLATPDAIQTLSLALSDEDSRIRKAALEALSSIGDDESLAAIAGLSAVNDPRMRADATLALGSTDENSSIEYLKLALRDDSPIVRVAAINSLGDISDEYAIRVIQQALQDPDPEVRERAIEVIDEINDDAAFRALYPPD